MNLIASVDKNWGIGFQGKLLLNLSEDMKWFKKHTLDKIVIMGQLTLESLPEGKPLKNRTNMVFSDDPNFSANNCIILHNLNELWKNISNYPDDDIFVIGGASIYALLLPYCHKAYITKFHRKFEADRYLPNLDQIPYWRLLTISDDYWEKDLCYNFCVYKNIQPKKYF